MKVRVKFSKHGAMRFIGHLDVMRYFQKAIRRAGLPIVFTEGFSPHMVMSFASPLGVGLESEGEYMDIEISSPVSTEEALETLNAVMVDGIRGGDFRKIPEEKASNAMALVQAADYLVKFREGMEPSFDWQAKLKEFFTQDSILVLKKTKKSEKEMNIRPLIYDWKLQDDALFLRLSSGSSDNLKPELVMDAFFQYAEAEKSAVFPADHPAGSLHQDRKWVLHVRGTGGAHWIRN